MAFSISPRRDPGAPRDLSGQIDAELRERIAEAVDSVCLHAMVVSRRSRGRPVPRADSARDREEFDRVVRAFLERLRVAVPAGLAAPLCQRAAPGAAEIAELVAVQAGLAKELPDYWQRFEEVRAAWATEARTSGGEGGGLLRRLFGGG